MKFFRKYRTIISALFAVIICITWLIILALIDNYSGSDTMGMVIIVWPISAPFLGIFFYKLIYKFLKPKDDEQEGLKILQNKIGTYWLVIILGITFLYFYSLFN